MQQFNDEANEFLGKQVTGKQFNDLIHAPGTVKDRFRSLVESQDKELARETLEHNDSALGSIPQDIRKKVNAEFIRLKTKHPDWKMDRLMKNAGKKHGIKFTFE